MLTEDYCSKKVSKLLKEAGFDIPCRYAWHDGITIPDFHRHLRNFNGGDYKDLRTKWYSAPTHQMAMKWLREKDVFIGIDVNIVVDNTEYLYHIYINTEKRYVDRYISGYDTHEQAVEAALKYSLENLI